MGLYLRKDNTNKLRNKFYLIIQENSGVYAFVLVDEIVKIAYTFD